MVKVGETFGETFSLSQAEIAEFARLAGDFNPLHHDPEAASQSRFGGIIASGPHTASRFMGLTASYFSERGAALGLEFSLQFRKAVYPDELLSTHWQVVSVEWKEKLGGEIVRVEGSMTNPEGQVVISGVGTLLVSERL